MPVALKGSQIVRNYMLPSLQSAPKLVKGVVKVCYEDLNMETRLYKKNVNPLIFLQEISRK